MSTGVRMRGVTLVVWAARATAILLLSLVLLIVVGEGVLGEGLPNLAKTSASQDVQFAALAIMCVGLGIGCFRDGVGGAIALGGLAAFYGIDFAVVGRWPGGAFPWFAVPGVLFLASFVIRKATARQ